MLAQNLLMLLMGCAASPWHMLGLGICVFDVYSGEFVITFCMIYILFHSVPPAVAREYVFAR